VKATGARREPAALPQAWPAPSPLASIAIADVALVLDPAGALYWPEEGALVVADLHLEKGSSFAARGVLLPPYDTAATLAALARLIAHYAPRLVIALGDSFHDGGGPARVTDVDRATLTALQRGREWLWIAGNHDPHRADGIGGRFAAMLALGRLVFRHEPATLAHVPAKWTPVRRQERGPLNDPRACPDSEGTGHALAPEGEVAGHLHPVARIAVRGRGISRRCFASDGRRIVMPAFGAYAGGLNVRDRAFAELFASAFTAHLLGDRRLYALDPARCLRD
jgi:DNA ligase-associated metallophosphoesterase